MIVTRTVEPSEDWLGMADAAGSFYHHPEWIAHISLCFRFDTCCFEARSEGGGLEAILALALVPAFPGLAPRRLVSFPFSYASGVLSKCAEARSALLSEARSYAAETGTKMVEVKEPNAIQPPGDGYSRLEKHSTFKVPTDRGIDLVWERLNASSTRRGIRKGEKSGLVVEHADCEAAWREMHSLQVVTSASHGVPPPPQDFFAVHCRALQSADLADLYLARDNAGRAVAGIVIWKSSTQWIYAFGASRRESLKQRPNHLLIWQAMKDAAGRGVVFDMGRAAPEQESLVEFKTRWGGVATPLAYDYWPRPAGLNVRMRTEGRLSVGARIWARLPAGITRAASPIYRYLG